MKNNLFLSILLAGGLLNLNLSAFARGNSKSAPEIQDVQNYEARFSLEATPDANPGAKGKAEIQAENQNLNQTATLSLQVQGLDAGEYTITGITASDGSSVVLGQMTLDDPSNGNGRAGRLKSSNEIDLPDYVDANNIAQLIVSDSNGTDLLQGDLTGEATKSKATFNATVAVTPGDAAPDATGFAKLKSSMKKGQIKNNFVLLASGLPPETTYTVTVDGTEVATVTSNKQGRVIVKKLPSDIVTIGTVELLDPDGFLALRADF